MNVSLFRAILHHFRDFSDDMSSDAGSFESGSDRYSRSRSRSPRQSLQRAVNYDVSKPTALDWFQHDCKSLCVVPEDFKSELSERFVAGANLNLHIFQMVSQFLAQLEVFIRLLL